MAIWFSPCLRVSVVGFPQLWSGCSDLRSAMYDVSPMKQLRFVWIFLACTVSVFAQKGGFTLEQVMSSPFPTGLTAAAKANRVAWVFNAKGERNVWIADAPSFSARQVTHYKGDDGQEILALRLTPDAKAAVYARGSDVSGEGHVANPPRDPREPKQQSRAAKAETGNSRPL